MLSTWDKFYADILMDVPTCANPVMDRALMRASQEFFDATGVWKFSLDPLVTEANKILYEMTVGRGEEIVRLNRATLSAKPIDIVSVHSLPSDWETNANIGDCIFTVDRRNIYLLPTPKVSGALLKIEVALKPSAIATGIDSVLFSQYAPAISVGARSILMAQPKQEYTDLNRSVLLDREFKDLIAVNALRSQRGFSSFRPRTICKTF